MCNIVENSKNMNRPFFISFTLLLLLFLWSCGGDESPISNPNIGLAPANPNKAVLANLINTLRENGQKCTGTQYEAVPVLTFNETLNQIAQSHAVFMDSIDELTHTGENDENIGERAKAGGYDYTTIAENLAKGYADEASVIDAWKNSSGHCENMMNANVREMGVGTSGAYWVMVYGVE